MKDKDVIYRLESLSREYGELFGRVCALMGYVRSEEEYQARNCDCLPSIVTVDVQISSSAIEQMLAFRSSAIAEEIVKKHNEKILAEMEINEKEPGKPD